MGSIWGIPTEMGREGFQTRIHQTWVIIICWRDCFRCFSASVRAVTAEWSRYSRDHFSELRTCSAEDNVLYDNHDSGSESRWVLTDPVTINSLLNQHFSKSTCVIQGEFSTAITPRRSLQGYCDCPHLYISLWVYTSGCQARFGEDCT